MEQKTDAQKTILIVEDEKNIVDILRFNLQREGYRTVEAYDGADGLEKARKENPDLILLDVMLPKMIGFDAASGRGAAVSPSSSSPPGRRRPTRYPVLRSAPMITLPSPSPCGS